MFETVVPETFAKRSKKVFYETLPVSLAAHALAIAGTLLGTVWHVVFPDHSPRVIAAYSLTAIPDPPPPPPPVQPIQPAPTPEPKTAPPPPPPALLEMAPRVIPNLVPHVEIPPPVPPPPPARVAVAEAVPGGDAQGEKGGKLGGEVGGKGTGLAFSVVFPDDGRVYIDRDAKLPLVPINQNYPSYPHEAVKLHLEDSVLVRYVIGTNGRVKDVTILDHARNPMFDAPTVEAIKEWTFRPYKKDGKSVEVVHELTVFYQLVTR
jgi:periplasmic protein TonB